MFPTGEVGTRNRARIQKQMLGNCRLEEAVRRRKNFYFAEGKWAARKLQAKVRGLKYGSEAKT